MTAETRAHAFEPFFTTKDAGKGTGLGLAMVYGTVRQCGGFIFLESEVNRGTTFRLYFPAATPEADPAAGKTSKTRGDGAEVALTVLVVEDEPAVRNLVATALGHQGYRVLRASCGDEALALSADETGRIALLLTDAHMPGMSGVELASRLVRQRADMAVIVMSGFTEESLSVAGRPVPLLSKPFTPKELRQKVADVLAHPNL
jgi:two-component system cell cycle sensor histidine kinase/response regulator CckA